MENNETMENMEGITATEVASKPAVAKQATKRIAQVQKPLAKQGKAKPAQASRKAEQEEDLFSLEAVFPGIDKVIERGEVDMNTDLGVLVSGFPISDRSAFLGLDYEGIVKDYEETGLIGSVSFA